MRLLPLLALVLAGCAFQLPLEPTAAHPSAVPQNQLFEDVRILSADDMEGRLVGSPGGAKARAYLLGRLQQIGISPPPGMGVESPFTFDVDGQKTTGVNLIGVIPGTGGSDQALLVMAHYDHVGVREGAIYNGADDNASGVAGVLSLAASLRQKASLHDVIIAFVDGEEGGSRGARAMVADPTFRPELDRVVLTVNFDMLSRNDKNELYVSGAYHFPWLKPRLRLSPSRPP